MNYTTENKILFSNQRRWMLWALMISASLVPAGTVFALNEVLEADSDNDGWSDVEEIVAGTDPADPTDPWDSDEDGIADYLEFENGTDPLDPNDPPRRQALPVYAGSTRAPITDLIAMTSAPENAPDNVGIIGLGNTNFDAPPGFENGNKVERENGRKVQYHILGSDPSGWSALVGSGVEYWRTEKGETIGVELCAGAHSRGIKQRFSMDATKEFCGGYALVWEHYGRVPKSGSIDYTYTVRITAGDPSTGSAQPIGTELKIESSRVPEGGTAKECFFFGIDEADLPLIEEKGLWISMDPKSSGTFSAIVGKLRIVKICMAVDKNRDGIISFGSDDLSSEAEPYRFWINNDDDEESSDGVCKSSDDQAGASSPDLKNDKPNSLRDLEDFSRLQIRFLGDQEGVDWLWGELVAGGIKASIAVLDRGGTSPKIRLIEHLDSAGSLRYLYDAENAKGLIEIDSESYISEVVSEAVGWLSRLWNTIRPGSSDSEDTCDSAQISFRPMIDNTAQVNLLFEGVQVGLDKFTLFFSRSDDHLQKTASVWLELLDVREMFELIRLSGTPDGTYYGWETEQFGSFKQAWDEETDKQIVFVHGWNMEKDEVASYAETSFKRLWWQNYKGRFSAAYWPTGTSLFSYNSSEFTAWVHGLALKDYFDFLNRSGRNVSVMAHSMGNILVGSALRQGANLNCYALMNAAIPAECYDERAELRQEAGEKQLTSYGLKLANLLMNLNLSWAKYRAWTGPFVGDDPKQEIALRGYRGFLKDVSCSMVNFYLPQDFATEEAWEFNNSTQKAAVVGFPYKYKIGECIEMYERVHKGFDSLGAPIYDWELALEDVVDPHRVMAFVDSSKTKVAGTEGRMEPAENINMGDKSVEEDWIDFKKEHSAQFVWSLHRTWNFWVNLEDRLD